MRSTHRTGSRRPTGLRPRDTVLILALASALLLPGLGSLGLWAPDEPRYAAIAEEVRAQPHGPTGLVLLHLGGEPYTQKPPLYFWLAALAGIPGERVTEAAARAPSALAGILVVWLTAALGARLLGRGPALLASGILLTAWEFAHLARRAQLDVVLTLWTTLALFAFVRHDRGGPRRWLVLLHGAMGLAVLTKGPVGVLVPMAGIAVYFAWERRLRDLIGLWPWWAPLLSVAPGVAWVAAATALAPSGYFDAAIVENVFGRSFAGTSHARPIYYFALQFPLLFLPWSPLWIAVGVAARRALDSVRDPARARAWRLALAWVAASCVLFSLSSGKRGLYLLPVFPATALLCGDAVWRGLSRAALPRSLGPGLSVALGAICALAVATLFLAGARDIAVPIVPTALALAASALAVALWRRAGSDLAGSRRRVAIVVGLVAALEALVFNGYLPRIDHEKSPRELAEAAAEVTAPDEPVGLVSKRALLGGLAYYGNRRIEALSTPASIQRFLDTGGRVLVVHEREIERVSAWAPVEVIARARSGRRTLVVVTTAAAARSDAIH